MKEDPILTPEELAELERMDDYYCRILENDITSKDGVSEYDDDDYYYEDDDC